MKTIEELVAKQKYKEAAEAQKEVEELEKCLVAAAAAAEMEKCLVATAALEKVASKNEPIEAGTAQSVAQEIKIQQEQVAAKKKTLEELVAKRQYAGAAAAQDELLELQAKEKQMKEKIASKNDLRTLYIWSGVKMLLSQPTLQP